MKSSHGQITLVLLLVASLGKAVVVDDFTCTTHVKKDGKEILSLKHPFTQVIREPVGATPSGATVTASKTRFFVDIPEHGKVEFELNYRHALLAPPGKEPLAMQYVCASGSLGFGPDGVASHCVEPTDDPFGDSTNWTATTVKDGIPVFDRQGLLPWGGGVQSKGHEYFITVQCDHCVTYP
jgi:hypothetical protein